MLDMVSGKTPKAWHPTAGISPYRLGFVRTKSGHGNLYHEVFPAGEESRPMWIRSLRERLGSWYSQPGGAGELWRIAWPLILANSFWTLEVALDRVYLSRVGSLEVAASVPAAGLFW